MLSALTYCTMKSRGNRNSLARLASDVLYVIAMIDFYTATWLMDPFNCRLYDFKASSHPEHF